MTELRKNTGVIAAALLALLFVGPNYATTVERLGFQDVVERSDLHAVFANAMTVSNGPRLH